MAARGRYHHGDVAKALVREAVALARHGGPDAVVLREAARRVGVSPTAAYRHFLAHGDLLHAVKWEAQEALADALECGARGVPRRAGSDGADRAELRAEDAIRRAFEVGRAYVRFALDEPGLFRAAFCHAKPTRSPARAGDGDSGGDGDGDGRGLIRPDLARFRSLRVLDESLDELVHAGLLPPERRPGAQSVAWSAVHGLTCLLLDGSLGFVADDERDAAVRLTIRTVLDGLTRSDPDP